MDGRHMSLPSDSIMQPPYPSSSAPMNALNTSNISRIDSAVDMAGSPQHLQHPPIHNFNDPKSFHQPWQAHRRPSIELLSITLPLDGQQFLTNSPQAFKPNANHQQTISPSQNFSNRRYSYNPNGRQKFAPSSAPHPYSNHFTAPTHSGEASPTGSSLRSGMSHGSRPSKSYDGTLSQACHDTGSMGLNGTFTMNSLKETGDTTASGKSTP